ncbi:nitroreductase family protein [Clostridium sp. YIM B02515]|uniref:Nitroreductase family protein n=1 Tax=Clostridium rhizosphaerae TaxID=2803861 RepID=A0ABS1TET7_9CLOT|nr:nitroreductase family protein [Clostridium rhizosphaerae]MBL4937878.1 nitroreductase family protein [Clostridium rhizosphaerae]
MIVDLLKKRCSIRKFKQMTIPQDTIDYIIEAGRLSPSGGNEQPWVFGIVNDNELINKIAIAAYNQKWISSAPLVIVLCTTIVEDERGARNIQVSRFPKFKNEILNMSKQLYSKLNSEEHQSKIPGTNMVLAALEHGIYSTWVSYFNVNEVAGLLNLPPLYIPSEILVLGYPEGEIKPKIKKKKEEIIFINSYKKDDPSDYI